jgi:F-type H+-transporting ATPase subunit a
MSLLIAAESNPLSHVLQHRLIAPETGLETPFIDQFTLVSNQSIMQIVAAVLVVMLMTKAARMRRDGDELARLVPRGFGNAIEFICQMLRERVARPALGAHTDQFIPYIWSAFFFVLTCNLLGLIPLMDWMKPFVGKNYHYFGGTSTGNIMVTAALALTTLFMIVYNGLRLHGMEYVKHFFVGPPYLAWFIAFLELVGLGAKIFALAMRLCANMVAGHILLAVLVSFVAMALGALGTAGGLAVTVPVFLGTVAINFLEIFVALLQAFIFTFLTAMFIGQAVVLHHDEAHEDGPEPHAPEEPAEGFAQAPVAT